MKASAVTESANRNTFRRHWTQQAIADEVGKPQAYVSQLLCFGRFLDFIASGDNLEIPEDLTERKFRGSWSRV